MKKTEYLYSAALPSCFCSVAGCWSAAVVLGGEGDLDTDFLTGGGGGSLLLFTLLPLTFILADKLGFCSILTFGAISGWTGGPPGF